MSQMSWRELRDAEMADRKAQRAAEQARRNEEAARLIAEHRAEMFSLYPELPEPVLGALYSYAWQEGHSSGFSEVGHHFEEVGELVLKAYWAGRGDA